MINDICKLSLSHIELMEIANLIGSDCPFFIENTPSIVTGKGDKLLWRCSGDLDHFKSLTNGSSCLVGYRTYYGLPPLPNRTLMLDDRGNQYRWDWDWCIGGKKTYEKYAPFFTELHISHINDNSIGDVTFPDLSNLNPECKIFNYSFKIY